MEVRTALDRFYIEPFRDLLLELLEPARARAGRALDLGCGFGARTEALRALGLSAAGVDIDDDRIAAARSRYPACELHVADVTALPFPDSSFDIVFSCSVLQYVDHPRTLAECRRVLRPGGRAIFIENLAGHPLARLHRRWRRTARRGLPAHRVPISHLDLRDLRAFTDHLELVAVRTANLLTPVTLAPVIIAGRSARAERDARATIVEQALAAVDRRLLATRPELARYCWTALVCGEART